MTKRRRKAPFLLQPLSVIPTQGDEVVVLLSGGREAETQPQRMGEVIEQADLAGGVAVPRGIVVVAPLGAALQGLQREHPRATGERIAVPAQAGAGPGQDADAGPVDDGVEAAAGIVGGGDSDAYVEVALHLVRAIAPRAVQHEEGA